MHFTLNPSSGTLTLTTRDRETQMSHISLGQAVSTPNDVAATAALEAWHALRSHLDAKNREINDEVAHYPTPIARCDVQLSKLLEQRSRIYRELERMGE